MVQKALPPTTASVRNSRSDDALADASQTVAEDRFLSPPKTARVMNSPPRMISSSDDAFADSSQSMPTRTQTALAPEDGRKAVRKLSRRLTQETKPCLYYAFCALSPEDLPCYRSISLPPGGTTYPTFIKVGKTASAVSTRHRYITIFPEENVKNFEISERTWTAWHNYFGQSSAGDVRGLNSEQLHTRFEVEFKFWVSFYFISINFVLIHFM